MLIALLAVLGVDLIVIVVLAAGMFSRRRWVSRQPGAFKGAIRGPPACAVIRAYRQVSALRSGRSAGPPALTVHVAAG
jgi:hypothetical protein